MTDEEKALWANKEVVPTADNYVVASFGAGAHMKIPPINPDGVEFRLQNGDDILLSMTPDRTILVRNKMATDAEIVEALREWMTAMRRTYNMDGTTSVVAQKEPSE
jgi:hypothetical protein